MQNHPYSEDRVVVFTSLEGDEVGTYTRGTVRLEGGRAVIALNPAFALVTNPDIGLTTMLTPHGECLGLFVESLTTEEFVVQEMGGGLSDVEFDYLAQGLRIGFEEVSVVQKKTTESPIPSMADHDEFYAEHPELRPLNALERFRAMRRERGGHGELDLTKAQALRDAVGVFDPTQAAVELNPPPSPDIEPGGQSLMPSPGTRSMEEEALRTAPASFLTVPSVSPTPKAAPAPATGSKVGSGKALKALARPRSSRTASSPATPRRGAPPWAAHDRHPE